MQRKSLLIGMPIWTVEYPMHSLACVGGIFKAAGWSCTIEDLNVKIFRLAKDHVTWYWDTQDERASEDVQPDEIYDLHRNKIEALLKNLVENRRYDLIAFSVYTSTVRFSLRAAQFLKSEGVNVPILFGGAECFPSESGKSLLEERGPDIICQGEAELCLPAFLKEFELTADFRVTCEGFAYKRGTEIIDTGLPQLPSLADDLAHPDWTQFAFGLYRNPGDFASFFSRSCVGRCSFCSESRQYRRFRFRRADEVVRELLEVAALVSPYTDYPTVYFSDSLVNGHVKELERFCDLIIRSGARILWEGSARFRPEMTRALLKKMHQAGCTELHWGLESGSQRVLDLMNKRVHLDVAKRIIIDAHEVGIDNKIMMIVGFPGETAADVVTTIEAVVELERYAYFFNPSMLSLHPSTPLYRDYASWGLLNNDSEEWVTADYRNDYEVRMLRRVLLIGAIDGKPFAPDSADALEGFFDLDFNRYSVASDLAGITYDLWRRLGAAEECGRLLAEWEGPTFLQEGISSSEVRSWQPKSIDEDIPLHNWYSSDKNAWHQKCRILKLIFDAVEAMRRSAPEEACREMLGSVLATSSSGRCRRTASRGRRRVRGCSQCRFPNHAGTTRSAILGSKRVMGNRA